ncbi:MAG: DUF5698 domain-containing protein [bacterium]
MNQYILLTGLMVFVARIMDVSIGTIRTIVTIQGRIVIAFFLGIIEVVLWIVVVGTVINEIKESPILILFYSVGFATGNVVGILAERELAFGPIILKIITNNKEVEISQAFQQFSLNMTQFKGEGTHGPVTELFVVCHRRDLRVLIPLIQKIDNNAFYLTEQAREVSHTLKPIRVAEPTSTSLLQKIRLLVPSFHKNFQPGFPSMEQAGNTHPMLVPIHTPVTGWRSRFKKK